MTHQELVQTVRRLQAMTRRLDAHPQAADELARRVRARHGQTTGVLSETQDIIYSCWMCDDDDLWDFPGGSALRCLTCGPFGLQCQNWSECWNGEGEGEG